MRLVPGTISAHWPFVRGDRQKGLPTSRVVFELTVLVPVGVGGTSDPVRLKRAGVPVEHRAARTKPKIALAEIDRVIAAGVRFGCVLADPGYGLSAPFRQGLTARGLAWAVGIATLTGTVSRASSWCQSETESAERSICSGPRATILLRIDWLSCLIRALLW
jgi:hypothetical protein